jgi:hypothetical protein
MPTIEFPEGLTEPPGEWDIVFEDVSIVGERYRMAECAEFIAGLRRSFETGSSFGVDLERDPQNEHDPLAVRVLGYWLEKKLFSSTRHVRHIGYLPKGLAYKLSLEVDAHATISAELVAVEVDVSDSDDPINLVIHVLERLEP